MGNATSHPKPHEAVMEAFRDETTRPPFNPEVQLCKDLEVVTFEGINGVGKTIQHIKPALGQATSVSPHRTAYLPGEPRIRLDNRTIGKALVKELRTEDLDLLHPHLWLVAKQDSTHISSLTHQIVRGRKIIITEKPDLHLVWYYDRIFIKPLPEYLLSYAFWDYYLISRHSPIKDPLQTTLRKSALGFLRSYNYLIQRRSDFDLATRNDHCLLPEGVEYADFVALIESLEDVHTDSLSPRYQFGELRLSRLNFWTKVFLFHFTYHKTEGQYGPYFARFYGPILFLFGIISVVLSAMQVVLAALPSADSSNDWASFPPVSRGFSVFTLFVIVVIVFALSVAFLGMTFREIAYALKDLYHKRKKADGCGE